MKLKNVLNLSMNQTFFCVNCFKESNKISLRNIFIDSPTICDKCFNQFSIHFYKFKVLGFSCLSIYDYDDVFKSRLYQLKGCYDIVLARSFLESFIDELNLIYRSFYLVFVPSSLQDDLARGFNHVKVIFSFLKLKQLDILYKKMNYKQSEQSADNRSNIKNIIEIKNVDLSDKKILLVDDVITTGNTLKACINLLINKGAKSIKILTLSMAKNKQNDKTSMLKKAFLKLVKINKVD